MRLDTQDLFLCHQHLAMCQAVLTSSRTVKPAGHSNLSFLWTRAIQFYGRRFPYEAYWAAGEHLGLFDGADHPPRNPTLPIPEAVAWALISAKNEHLGLPTFHSVHPTANHATIWVFLPAAMRTVARERPSCIDDVEQ